ncbi:MFS transporter [Roseateles sp.]|uniref:MFS transporter n=1 Tax=Roseateles sp. TaxID=1971397 RepID=UPI0025DAFF01|nr:MFS transporter [Roseateles sp.]MBV8037233.1 MFS transporter [Roseateles sp.]
MASENAIPQGRMAEAPWWRLLDRNQWLIFAVASLSWLIDCFDQQIFNLARDGAIEHLIGKALATEYAPYTTSVFLVGWAIGGLTLGALGDRFGRVKMLTVAILLYAVCTGLSAFSTGFWDFCLYRLLTGVGVGGVFGLAVALVSDTVPDRSRAPALGMLQSLSSVGNIAAGLTGIGIGALALRGLLPLNLQTWQVLFMIGALPALFLVPVFLRMKEPQKWVDAKAEGARKGVQFGSYRNLLGHPTWRRHAWLGLVLCSAGIIGLWGIGNFHPKIIRSIIDAHLAGAGLGAEQIASEKSYWSGVGLLLQNLGGFCGMLALAKFAQFAGRKKAFALALSLSFLSTVMVFQYLREIDQIYWMLPLMGFGQYSVFAVYAIYLPELFPTSLRSTGTSFCYNFGRLVAATAPFTIGQVTRSLGGNIEGFRTAGVTVSVVLLIGLVVLPFLPETKDKPLPSD